MPVVRISGLPQAPGVDPGSVLKRLCLRLAEVDGVEARHWWATWQPIAPDAYLEGDVQAPAIQPGASHPPIVEILAFGGRDAALVEQLLTYLNRMLARPAVKRVFEKENLPLPYV